jgi:hypothetical protein
LFLDNHEKKDTLSTVSLERRAVVEWIRLNLFISTFCIGFDEFKDGIFVLGGEKNNILKKKKNMPIV